MNELSYIFDAIFSLWLLFAIFSDRLITIRFGTKLALVAASGMFLAIVRILYISPGNGRALVLTIAVIFLGIAVCFVRNRRNSSSEPIRL